MAVPKPVHYCEDCGKELKVFYPGSTVHRCTTCSSKYHEKMAKLRKKERKVMKNANI